ncbi:MAG: hypothetical protein R2710_27380 [Acidimicrobiales bacterium]
MTKALIDLRERSSAPRATERGSAVVEWLGISALSIGMLVGIFAALEQVGLSVVEAIRGSLGV